MCTQVLKDQWNYDVQGLERETWNKSQEPNGYQ